MRLGRPAFAMLCSALLAASLGGCSKKKDSGGGGGGGGGGGPTTYTLSGTITAAAGTEVDGDIADVNAPVTHNDTFGTAQPLPSAVTVGGWADAAVDPEDWYRATLAAGQQITLAIGDPVAAGTPDLDLCLFAVSAPTVPVACSLGLTGVEQVSVTAAGEYFVAVGAVDGGSNYTLTLGVGGAVAPTLRTDAEFVPGQVLVQFRRPQLLAAAARPLAAQVEALGLVLVDGDWDRPTLLELPPGGLAATALPRSGTASAAPTAALEPLLAKKLETLHAVKALRARADVETADPNYIRHAFAVPNDAHYDKQWHYPLINLPQAWDVTTGTPAVGNAVIVAVADTGVFLAHPDFTGQLVDGYDFVSSVSMSNDGNGIDANPDDPGDGAAAGESSWHGSHVAGTIAARSNDQGTPPSYGVAGVSWGAKIMPIRVLGVGGGTSADIINGVRFAAGLSNASNTVPARRADVLNLSLGGGSFSSTEQASYTAARNAGVIVVAAAGNSNTSTPSYPASYDGVVSVSAVDMRREKAPYSNFGTAVDVAAPGGDVSVDRNGDGYADGVLSPIADDSSGTRQPAWSFYQGTSMASPHVAGVVALMKAVCTTLTPAQLDAILSSGAMTIDLGTAGRDNTFGHGLVDAAKAVQAAQAQCGDTPAPSLQVSPPRLDLAAGVTTATLTATKVGAGTLTVTSVADDATWLTVTGPGGEGFGAYAVTVNTAGLGNGRYTATITFTPSSGSAVQVPVSIQVGAAASTADAGFIYALLVDDALNTVAQLAGSGTGGVYDYTFTGVAAGSYYIVAGSDHDNDNFICDEGEACGAWPILGLPTVLEVTGDQTGLDFLVGFDASLGAGGGAGAAPARQGFRLLPTKALRGAR